MGDDNPIQNNKLLREAYQKGRRQGINEVASGGDMGGGPGGGPGGGGGTRPAIAVDNSPIPDVNVEYFMNQAAQGMPIPNWVIEWFQTNAPMLYGQLRSLIAAGGRSVNMGGGLRESVIYSDNPIQNDKLLQEAYQAGAQAALNENMGMGMGMGMGMASPAMAPKSGMAAKGIKPGPGTYPGGVYDPQDGTPPQQVVPPCPFFQEGGRYEWVDGRWVVYSPSGLPVGVYQYPPGKWVPLMGV